ncbi:MAG TPA: hypothetical protein VKT70_02495, partial [Stellaceae bacterium]|nr:hypothetical protein [Stellaceae bacterium]
MPRSIHWAAGAALFLLAGLPEPARSHAIVLEAAPRIDAVVEARSLAIALRFNSRIDHAHSRLSLEGPDGRRVVLPQKDDES